MPELPEVEVLVRHLSPLLRDKRIRQIELRRAKVLRPTPLRRFNQMLRGAKFLGLSRRGKYLVFQLQPANRVAPIILLGHLGMTGRMYLLPAAAPLPRHTAVVLDLGRERFVFEDTRYFGRLTLDQVALTKLGPEPLGPEFTCASFAGALKRSRQAIKVKLLDQTLVAGLGNIYAGEALFRAQLSPALPARQLTTGQVKRLRKAIRGVLTAAIASGSTVPLDYDGSAGRDGLFYFGRAREAGASYSERLQVYDRAGRPCSRCGTLIRRLVQAGRSTFYCPRCQRR
jgi:formamidopyrimidine-DNA glycosylase